MMPGCPLRVAFYSDDELRDLLSNGKSIIRLGDGEINLLLGLDNHYQKFSSELQVMLREIIRSYSLNSAYVLGVPHAISERNDVLRSINRFNVWMPFKTMFTLLFKKHLPYMDAHAFYRDGYIERILAPALSEKTVILVTNTRTIAAQRANQRLPWSKIRFIEIPEKGALHACDRIIGAIDMELAALQQEETPVLLFAAGPLGKYLIKRYSENGYQAIDIGRGVETMFTEESIEHLI